MYDTIHFHSTTHEVLCVSRGRTRLCFGGEDNEGRIEPVLETGDVMVVPAGVGHRLMAEMDGGGVEMVGSYPTGKTWDMCYGRHGEGAKIESIEKSMWLTKDPIYGDQGLILKEGNYVDCIIGHVNYRGNDVTWTNSPSLLYGGD